MTAAAPPRAALMSIKPRWAEALLAGAKRAEFRTRYPLDGPRTVIVYATAPVSLVVGVLDLAGVDGGTPDQLWARHGAHAGLPREDFDRYFAGRDGQARALVVASARRCAPPVPLARVGLARPPQSWQYAPGGLLGRLG